MERGTVRRLALAPPSQSADRRRGIPPQIWCADASLSSAAAGTVRLHASSHARGLKLSQAIPGSSSSIHEGSAAVQLVILATTPWTNLDRDLHLIFCLSTKRGLRALPRAFPPLCLAPRHSPQIFTVPLHDAAPAFSATTSLNPDLERLSSRIQIDCHTSCDCPGPLPPLIFVSSSESAWLFHAQPAAPFQDMTTGP